MNEGSITVTASPRHALILSSTSFSVLAYEILLLRLMSIGQWHHLAYMVISMALLGFGAAGTFLFLMHKQIMKNPDEWLIFIAGATAVSFPLCFSLSQKIGLDPLLIIWQPIQWIKMLAVYLVLAIPFLLAGGIVGIILTGARSFIHRMYTVDLVGAGCGALCIIPALYTTTPWNLLLVLGLIVILGSVWSCFQIRYRIIGPLTLLISLSLMTISFIIMPPQPVIHEAKSLPMTMALPDARIEVERNGPLGKIQVIGSSAIRHAPGLSLKFGLAHEDQDIVIPTQKALFLDADGLSPITSFKESIDDLKYLGYTSMALPYHIRQQKKVLVVGAGGGSDVLTALLDNSSDIVALEANQQVADILLGPLADFSGNLYSRPEVRLIVKEGREYIHSSDEIFDLIQISMIDSYVNSAGGLHSATESYLFTVEAFDQFIKHLDSSGILAISQWLKFPPRNSLRIFTTALAALSRTNISSSPEKHLLFIRSWKTFTILVSKMPFTEDEIQKTRDFCSKRNFDIVYYTNMKQEEANQFDVLDSPLYFNSANLLSGVDAESFLDEYIFDVSACRDDRPFFSHFFRWQKAPDLYSNLKREWLPLIELGYVFILATSLQVIFAGLLLILLPLVFLRRIKRRSSGSETAVGLSEIIGILVYFSAIGAGFMFLEMAFLSKYALILSHPVYSASVVLATVLIFAGIGSLSVRYIQKLSYGFLWAPVVIILCWIIFHWFGGESIVSTALKWPFVKRLAFSVLWLSVPAFFMGWAFPAGLARVLENHPGFVPWAWGINGCASVLGAVLGKCIAVEMGFRFLMFSAWVLYIIAVVIFYLVIARPKRSLDSIPVQ